jgi:hypothetical protein
MEKTKILARILIPLISEKIERRGLIFLPFTVILPVLPMEIFLNPCAKPRKLSIRNLAI